MFRLLLSASALPNAALAEWRYRRPSAHWRDHQFKRLVRFVRYAYEHSAFYRECWNEAGIQPSQITSVEDFGRLPIIAQKMWRELPDTALQSSSTGRTVFTRQTSSTSGGAPLILPVTLQDEWQLRVLLFQTQMHQHMGLFERKLAMLPPDPRYFRKYHPLSRLDRTIAEADAPDHLKALIESQQAVVVGNPFVIWRAVVAAIRAGINLPSRRIIQVAGEVLTDSMQRTIELKLGGKIKQIYGATDYGRLGLGCEHGKLHITPQATYVEIMNGNEVAKAGEVGEVVVTNFLSHGRPLVRVRTGDLAVWGQGRCACGSALPYFERMLGRTKERVVLPDGRLIYWTDVEQALASIGDDLLGFQVVQSDPASVLVRLSLRDARLPDVQYRASLNSLFAEMQVNIELTDHFPAEKSGKTRVIITD